MRKLMRPCDAWQESADSLIGNRISVLDRLYDNSRIGRRLFLAAYICFKSTPGLRNPIAR
jgi:hypothetical protein